MLNNLKLSNMKGASIDAILLTVVRVVTMLMGFVCTKIVSVYFSLDSYGLYSQALLIISTVTSISILGMTDAVNFFFNNNSKHKNNSPEEYLGTVFGLQTIVGGLCGFGIILGIPLLVDYFDNPALWVVYGWIAFQPLLQNYIPMLQVLYMSAGRAKSIVFVNLLISILRLTIFILASLVFHDIVVILALTLCSDIIQVVYFWIDLRRHGIKIDLRKFNVKLCRPILAYAIPMAGFVIINSLMRDADKWVIGYFATTEDLAIYTNCSKLLPFDMLAYSFCLVLVPIITRNLATDINKVKSLYGDYLNLGLLTTSILVIPAFFLSKDLLLCLYDAKYLPGLTVFCIYLMVDFSRFANVSLLYNASGRSRQLLSIVCITFLINAVGAIVLYKCIGLTGPAVATLISMWISYVCYMKGSSKILGDSVAKLFLFRPWYSIVIECVILGLTGMWISSRYLSDIDAVLRFIFLYGLVVGSIMLLNWKKVVSLMRSINRVS